MWGEPVRVGWELRSVCLPGWPLRSHMVSCEWRGQAWWGRTENEGARPYVAERVRIPAVREHLARLSPLAEEGDPELISQNPGSSKPWARG